MNELSIHTPELVEEAFLLPGETIDREEKFFVDRVFELLPIEDEDRYGWLYLLKVSMEGYMCRQGLTTCPDSIATLTREIQRQIDGDGYKDWMTAWNTIRWIPGQGERMISELDEYREKYAGGAGEFDWTPTLIGLIIMIVRLDHPEYQQG